LFEREGKEEGGVVRDFIFKEGTKICSALKVLKQYSFVLLLQVCLREGKALGSGKGKGLRCGLYEQSVTGTFKGG
jgi:hypothetical protein